MVFDLSRPNPGRREKFYTSFLYLKRFYEGHKGLYKSLIFISVQLSEKHGTLRLNNPFKISYFKNNFMHAMTVLVYLPK